MFLGNGWVHVPGDSSGTGVTRVGSSTQNRIGDGGAVYSNGATLVITSSVFKMNLAKQHVVEYKRYRDSGLLQQANFTLNSSTFQTDFVQSCAALSHDYAAQTETCATVHSCKQLGNSQSNACKGYQTSLSKKVKVWN